METLIRIRVITCTLACSLFLDSFAQIGINTTKPDSTVVLDVESNDQGILIPRISGIDNLKFAPANGLIIYDSERNNLSVFDSATGWQELRPFPAGGIIMWSGTKENIPKGWVLCNGLYYNPLNSKESSTTYQPGWVLTPDLTNRFILSANTSYNVNTVGGNHDITLNVNQLPSHTHTGTTNSDGLHIHGASIANSGAHEHNTDTDGYHNHRFRRDSGSNGGNGSVEQQGAYTSYEQTMNSEGSNHAHHISSSGNHTHDVTINNTNSMHQHAFTTNTTGGNQAFDNRPAYYVLAFIIKL